MPTQSVRPITQQLASNAFRHRPYHTTPRTHVVLSDPTVRQTLGPLYENRYTLLEKRALRRSGCYQPWAIPLEPD